LKTQAGGGASDSLFAQLALLAVELGQEPPCSKQTPSYKPLLLELERRLDAEMVVLQAEGGALELYHKRLPGGEMLFSVARCGEGLERADRAVLQALDTDNSGWFTSTELVAAARRVLELRYCKKVLRVAILLFFPIVFLVTWYAGTVSQATDIVNGVWAPAGGGNEIIKTANAEQAVPLALTPLLSIEGLARVEEFTLTNLHYLNGTACVTCAELLVFKLQAVASWNETYVAFVHDSGVITSIDKGVITVTGSDGMGGNGDMTLVACAMATCSSIRVEGVDLPALKARARALGYVNTGRRVFSVAQILKQGGTASLETRRNAGKSKQCRNAAASSHHASTVANHDAGKNGAEHKEGQHHTEAKLHHENDAPSGKP